MPHLQWADGIQPLMLWLRDSRRAVWWGPTVSRRTLRQRAGMTPDANCGIGRSSRAEVGEDGGEFDSAGSVAGVEPLLGDVVVKGGDHGHVDGEATRARPG